MTTKRVINHEVEALMGKEIRGKRSWIGWESLGGGLKKDFASGWPWEEN